MWWIMIDNFLLLYYSSRDMSSFAKKPTYPKDEFSDLYEKMQRPFLDISIQRISKLYPKSKIHILTNEKIVFNENEYEIFQHVNKDLPRNHLAKLKIYSLLNEPCMYMDSDILLNRQFSEDDLRCSSRFKLFRGSLMPRIANYLHLDNFKLHNAGIVWIKEPGVDLTDSFEQIHQEIFSDHMQLSQHGLNENVDEFSIAYWCMKNNLQMETEDLVGKPRGQIDHFVNVPKYQSVHYMHLEFKLKFIKEFYQLYLKFL